MMLQFFCQHACEKALLLETLKKYSKIHDLITLAKLVKAPQEILAFSSLVNPDYIVSRYPEQTSLILKKIVKR